MHFSVTHLLWYAHTVMMCGTVTCGTRCSWHTHSVSPTVKGSWANLYFALYVKFMYSPVCADHDDVMVMYIGCHASSDGANLCSLVCYNVGLYYNTITFPSQHWLLIVLISRHVVHKLPTTSTPFPGSPLPPQAPWCSPLTSLLPQIPPSTPH